MKLLDAINLILPKLGEHRVTRVDIKHPTIAIIVPEVENVLTQTCLQGWWFNEFYYTATRDSEGTITMGSDVLAFTPEKSGPYAVLRDGKLYNPETLAYTWTENVRGVVKQSLIFDELPESAKQYVWYTALVTVYVTDIGLGKEVQLWQAMAANAYGEMLAEHIRQRKYSTKQSTRYMRLRRAMRS